MDRQENGAPVSPRDSYWLTRFMILRLLGFVYAAAFYSAARQIVPLIGAKGILPVGEFMDFLVRSWGTKQVAFWHYPSVFWFGHSDAALLNVSWIGFGISVLVIFGWANVPIMAVLWALYMSIVHVGQTWYAYGWETQLLETGFLAIFLCPLIDARPFSNHEPPLPTVWLFRWLIFRIMLGAGLIKLRGDVVWRDLTALYYHFETQPLPNGLSRWFHFLPHGVLKGGVAMNHLAEVVAPFFVFWPRRGRLIAGGVIVLFHVILILSGNLSFLNWLTIVPALACFDDRAWIAVMPFMRRSWERAIAVPLMHFYMRCFVWVIVVLVAVLSISPVRNLMSPDQVMNTSFTWFDLVNTYGAFGSVGRERYTIVFEGTDSADLVNPVWRPYLYVAQPVDVDERPKQVAPYQPRLDWAVWFAAMASPNDYPWTLHVVWKLLHNDPGMLSLFRTNPFPDRPPRFIRVELYQYRFARPGEAPGRWWDREDLGHWLRPLSVNTQPLREFMERAGWLEP